jgi:hypothetical protein
MSSSLLQSARELLGVKGTERDDRAHEIRRSASAAGRNYRNCAAAANVKPAVPGPGENPRQHPDDEPPSISRSPEHRREKLRRTTEKHGFGDESSN